MVARPSRAMRVSESEPAVDPVWLRSTALATSVLAAQPALATGGEFGLLEGRSVALIHPIVMAVLFGYTAWAGWLGWQWRETRTIGDKIKEIQNQLPEKDEDGNRPSSPLDGEVAALQDKRKALSQGDFKNRHFNAGSLLLAFGVTIAVEGSLNTWMRTGKLFPGPHLFEGAGIVCLWAIAAALVPAMQKGNDTARTAHIGANALNLFLFASQIPTGWEIVLKVFQFTTWP